jgi:hypothetical protein
MTRITKGVLLALHFCALTAPLVAQGTYTAKSCNQSDVNAVINGPTHTAVAGDTINIPSGTCTWTSGLSISVGITLTGSGTPNTGPSTFGAGTLNTVIIDNAGSSAPMIAVTGSSFTYGQTLTIAMLDIEPNSASAALWSPITIAGTCTSSGCPNIRVDNLGFGLTTPWTESGNSSNADWMVRADNVFGVVDHNTVPANSSQIVPFNFSLSAYLGVGAYGDNSWAQPDTFGGANVVYMENNSVWTSLAVNDCDVAPLNGAIGGCRIAGRFNHITCSTCSVPFTGHGLDTDGRPQGVRQIEAYGNTVTCVGGECSDVAAGFRSGTGYVFGNQGNDTHGVTAFNQIADSTVYRTVFTNVAGWGACGGSGPYDTNDGTIYYTGTTSTSGTTLTDSTKSWTTNQFIPNGAPYSVHDVTQGWWAEIASNTATTLTIQTSIPEQTNTFNSGDSYQTLRATVCVNQGGRGAGTYVSGSTPSPASAISQALDPIYEWDDTVMDLNGTNFTTDTGKLIANRDWYTDNSGGKPVAQTSATSPFKGASGVGFGTLALRPTTCTTGVGYFATDQGSWNTSGNGFGSGVLYKCSSTNTWTLAYTPYAYPHPLTQGTGNAAPAPPTSLAATAN